MVFDEGSESAMAQIRIDGAHDSAPQIPSKRISRPSVNGVTFPIQAIQEEGTDGSDEDDEFSRFLDSMNAEEEEMKAPKKIVKDSAPKMVVRSGSTRVDIGQQQQQQQQQQPNQRREIPAKQIHDEHHHSNVDAPPKMAVRCDSLNSLAMKVASSSPELKQKRPKQFYRRSSDDDDDDSGRRMARSPQKLFGYSNNNNNPHSLNKYLDAPPRAVLRSSDSINSFLTEASSICDSEVIGTNGSILSNSRTDDDYHDDESSDLLFTSSRLTDFLESHNRRKGKKQFRRFSLQ